MQRVKIILNNTEVTEEQAIFLKTFGSFNFHPTVLITGSKSATNSNIAIFCYTKPTREVPIACKVSWERLQNSQVSAIPNTSNFYHCSTKDLGCYIQCIVRPVEEGFSGECKVAYGPVALDQETEMKFQLAKKDHSFRSQVTGHFSGNKAPINMVEVHGNKIRGLNHNMELVGEMEMSPDTMVILAPNDPNKLKVLNHDAQELHLTVNSVVDKDVLVMLLEYRKNKPSENSKILEDSVLGGDKLNDSFAISAPVTQQKIVPPPIIMPSYDRKTMNEAERPSTAQSQQFASKRVVFESANKNQFKTDESADNTPRELNLEIEEARGKYSQPLAEMRNVAGQKSKQDIPTPRLQSSLTDGIAHQISFGMAKPKSNFPSDHQFAKSSEEHIDEVLRQYVKTPKINPPEHNLIPTTDPDTHQLRASIHKSLGLDKHWFSAVGSQRQVEAQEQPKLPADSFFNVPTAQSQRVSLLSAHRNDPLAPSGRRIGLSGFNQRQDPFLPAEIPVVDIPDNQSQVFKKKSVATKSQIVSNPDLFAQIEKQVFEENESEKQKLDKERQSYQNEINKLKTANKSLLREIEYLNQKRKIEEEDKDAETKEMEIALFKESSRMKDSLKASQSQIEALKEQLRFEQERAENGEKNAFVIENENFNLRLSIQEAEQTVERLRVENEAFEKKQRTNDEKMIVLMKAVEELEEKLVKASTAAMSAEANERACKELAREKEGLIDLVDQLKTESGKNEELIKVLNRSVKEKDNEMMFLAGALEDANQRNAEQAKLLEKYARGQEESKSSGLVVQKYEATLKRLQDAEKGKEEAENERDSVKLEMQKLRLELESLREKADRNNLFKEALSYEKTRRADLEKMTLANTIGRLEEENKEHESTRRELTHKVDILEAEVLHLRNELNSAKETLIMAGHENEELINTLKMDNVNLRQGIAQKQAELQTMASRLADAQKENQTLRSRQNLDGAETPIEKDKLLSAMKASNIHKPGRETRSLANSLADSGIHAFTGTAEDNRFDFERIRLEEENQKLRDDVYHLREEKLSLMSRLRRQQDESFSKPVSQQAVKMTSGLRSKITAFVSEFNQQSKQELDQANDAEIALGIDSVAEKVRVLRSSAQNHDEFVAEANRIIASGERKREQLEEKIEELEEQRNVLMDLVGKV